MGLFEGPQKISNTPDKFPGRQASIKDKSPGDNFPRTSSRSDKFPPDVHSSTLRPNGAQKPSKWSYPKSIEALIIGGTKNRKAQR